MNFRTRFYKPALLALAAILFCVVAQVQSQLNVDRKEMGLTKMDPLENAPPGAGLHDGGAGQFPRPHCQCPLDAPARPA